MNTMEREQYEAPVCVEYAVQVNCNQLDSEVIENVEETENGTFINGKWYPNFD